MLGNVAPPTVRVIVVCPGCSAPFEAVQTRRKNQGGMFACKFCGDEMHSWSGHYEYTGWRSVRRPQNREAWS